MSPINEIIFSHPSVRIQFQNSKGNLQPLPLTTSTQSVTYNDGGYGRGSELIINIKPNQLTWSYGLNTQSFPTYAGEVVQILSAYVDNLTISGDIRTYSDMELIYKWFIAYMTIATQGLKGTPVLSNEFRYNETPVLMQYLHRGWSMYIRPLSLPTLTYGTDVVVPNWQMQAAVVEDENMQLTMMMNSDIPALVQTGLKSLDANFGLGVENPFNYWNGSYEQGDINKFLGGQKPILNSNPNNTQLSDFFQNLVTQYASGNVDLASSNTAYSTPYTQSADISSQVTVAAGTTTTNSLGGIPSFSGLPTVIPKSITSPGTPAGVVQAAQIAASQQTNYQYNELTGQARDPAGGLFGPNHPIILDCSSFVTLCFQAASVGDPNNMNYNPIGNTTSLMANATLLGPLVSPQPGYLHFWSGPDHVAVATDSLGGIIEMVPNGPIALTVAAETPYHTSYLGCFIPNEFKVNG